MGKNGYFKLMSKDDGLYINVYPSKEGGQMASIESLIDYCAQKGLSDTFDIVNAKAAFVKSDKVVTLKLSDNKPLPNNEFAVYSISSDRMMVEATFYPPFEDAGELSQNEIMSDLNSRGVNKGIDISVIDNFLKDREYFVPYIVAKGQPPVEGHDGFIEYKFNVVANAKPKVNEDGTVDFHNLDNVNHIKKDDVVAVLHPDDMGKPGYDVKGSSVYPRKVKRVLFKYGRNLHVSEDGLQLITDVNGHVSLEGDKIFVSDIIEFVDIDNSTGNVNYDGNVMIKGNVLSGFSVNATGNVTVQGLVEGADITAGGDITLLRGVQGGNRANLVAGGNIVSKFIESANMVSAGGSIDTDSLLHSKAVAKGPITVKGRNGLIVGGDVRSSVLIDCKTIGNTMGTATVVGVGVDPTVKKKIDVLKKELEDLGKQKMQLSQITIALRKKQEMEGGLAPEKLEMQQKTTRQIILLDQKINADKNELEECRKMISEDVNARIKISKSAFVGTKVMFGDQYIFLREKYDYVQFLKQGADIKAIGL